MRGTCQKCDGNGCVSHVTVKCDFCKGKGYINYPTMYLEGVHGKLTPIIPADFYLDDSGQNWLFKVRGDSKELHHRTSNLFLVYKKTVGRFSCTVVPVPVADFVAISDVNKCKRGI